MSTNVSVYTLQFHLPLVLRGFLYPLPALNGYEPGRHAVNASDKYRVLYCALAELARRDLSSSHGYKMT